MKIHFTATFRGKQQYGKYFERIFNEIIKLGHDILEDSIIKMQSEEFYEHLDIHSTKSLEENYDKVLKIMQRADINIFESSFHSISTGFLINKSLELHKPTIVLYYKNNVPILLAGNDNDKLIVKKYDDESLESVVNKTIDEAMQIRDKRFNLFLSDELLRYLERASKKEGFTKSNFVRNLIIRHMKENEFKN